MVTSNCANIVLFGQAGAGKSSVVNLMAGENIASTSSDLKSCTLHWQEYPIRIGSESYKVFDTVGLQEPQLDIPQYLDAIENAYKLIQKLQGQGGIDLLLFCMRAGRLTTTLQTNYRLFHEFLCEKKVPIIVVITCLENEAGEMDAWWTRNIDMFNERKVDVADHACVTALEGNHPERYEESRTTICELVKKFTADGGQKRVAGKLEGDSMFVSFMRKLKELLGCGKLRAKKDIVPRLIKSCGLSPDNAKKLANEIKEPPDSSRVR